MKSQSSFVIPPVAARGNSPQNSDEPGKPLPLAQVRYGYGKSFDQVVGVVNVAGLFGDQDADPGERFSGFPKFILDQFDGLRFAVNVDGNAFFRSAIDDAVALNAVAVRRKCFVPTTKVDSSLATSPYVIVANEIVRITVAEGHPIVAILDRVLFVQPMLRAPAEVNALGAVPHSIAPDDRTLRSGAGVKRQSGAIMQ